VCSNLVSALILCLSAFCVGTRAYCFAVCCIHSVFSVLRACWWVCRTNAARCCIYVLTSFVIRHRVLYITVLPYTMVCSFRSLLMASFFASSRRKYSKILLVFSIYHLLILLTIMMTYLLLMRIDSYSTKCIMSMSNLHQLLQIWYYLVLR